MKELHLVLLLVNTNGHILGYDPSGHLTAVQAQTAARPGTYCRYERGVVVYEPKVTTECPQVFQDVRGHLHIRGDRP